MKTNNKNIKIKKIEVKNMRSNSNSIKHINFSKELQNLNFIIGENGSGKSTWIQIFKDLISGKKTKDFSYDLFSIETTQLDNNININNKIHIKNFFYELAKKSKSLNMDIRFSSWDPFHNNKNNDINVFTSNIQIRKLLKKCLLGIINEKIFNFDEGEKEEIRNNINLRQGNQFTSYFNNNLSHIVYRINSIISDNDFFNSEKRIELNTFFINFIFHRDTNFNDRNYENEINDYLDKNGEWLSENEKNKLKKMVENYSKTSKDINLYFNSILFPLKEKENLRREIEFIHSERISADEFKREGLNSSEKNPPLYYEFNKNNEEILSKYNMEKNRILDLIKNKILNNIDKIEMEDDKSVNDSNKFKINEILMNAHDDMDFIKNIFSSKTEICHELLKFITNDPEIINNIEKSVMYKFCVNSYVVQLQVE